MNAARRSEKKVRVEILEQALSLADGQTANYFREPEKPVARELVRENLVTGSAKESGGVGVTGIRDAGRDYLKAQRPLQKIMGITKRVLFSISIIAVLGYILNLNSVKTAISDLIGRFLKR